MSNTEAFPVFVGGCRCRFALWRAGIEIENGNACSACSTSLHSGHTPDATIGLHRSVLSSRWWKRWIGVRTRFMLFTRCDPGVSPPLVRNSTRPVVAYSQPELYYILAVVTHSNKAPATFARPAFHWVIRLYIPLLCCTRREFFREILCKKYSNNCHTA